MRRPSQIRYVSIGSGPAQASGGLLTRIVAFLVGAIVIGIAIFLGAIFIAGIVGLLLIGSVVFMARVWWLNRQAQKYAQEHGDLNADYIVVDEEKERD